jgi:hypothetical protein
MFVETASTITSVGGSNKWRAVTLFLAITAASQWIRGKMVIGIWNGQSERGTICIIRPTSVKLNA